MTLFSDLATYLDNYLSAVETEKYLADVYNETLATEPALPTVFADQAAYDSYTASVVAWQAACATALANRNAANVTTTAEGAVLLAAIPVGEAGYTIARGGKSYTIGIFADSAGVNALRWQDAAGAVSIMARPATATFAAEVPAVSGG